MVRLLKRVRQRFGISAPKMTVNTHVAWYWRWLGMMLVASISLALAAWIYDAGRRFAGFDRSEVEEELARLRESTTKLQAEAARLRGLADAGESRLKIEQSAQKQLGTQVRVLEEENSRLKEDLAFFENLIPSERRGEKVSIHRFNVLPDALPGEYRYRMLVMQGGPRDREFQGSMQLVVEVRQGNRNAMIVLPGDAGRSDPSYKLAFKYFHRVEGSFRVPPEAKVRTVRIRVMENGSTEARASQSVDLS
ncbi:MAG: hypothetical protein EXR27_06070 [Betaproteobacteria bacterium]|nr:hypothetical protein [Betaproteobacteria bacterium]